jgi:hypothetical protein
VGGVLWYQLIAACHVNHGCAIVSSIHPSIQPFLFVQYILDIVFCDSNLGLRAMEAFSRLLQRIPAPEYVTAEISQIIVSALTLTSGIFDEHSNTCKLLHSTFMLDIDKTDGQLPQFRSLEFDNALAAIIQSIVDEDMQSLEWAMEPMLTLSRANAELSNSAELKFALLRFTWFTNLSTIIA